jgi:hypothetical protein
MRQLIAILTSVYLAALPLVGQTAYPSAASNEAYVLGYSPNSLTAIVSRYVLVDEITLTNDSASDVTYILQDQTTSCNSGACQLLASVSVAANATYVITFRGRLMKGGMKENCSAANALVRYIRYRY